MKLHHQTAISIACALLGSGALLAEEPTPEMAGLQKAATDFVEAYNKQDAAAISKLFTEEGELTDLNAEELTTGREQIQARYVEIFKDKPLHIAIEVGSVRLVSPNLAIEDGVFHLTPAEDETAPARSTSYTAVLAKDTSGAWQIASSRTIKDVTDSSGQLTALANVLKGEWTHSDPEGVRLDLAFGWDAGGKNIIAEMLTSTADAEPQAGSIRIGWDASKQQIVSWMFDANGGSNQGVWTPTEDGWLIRSEGTTGDGESLTASQQLTSEGADTLIWAASHRVLDGEKVPDRTLRLVRQAPESSED